MDSDLKAHIKDLAALQVEFDGIGLEKQSKKKTERLLSLALDIVVKLTFAVNRSTELISHYQDRIETALNEHHSDEFHPGHCVTCMTSWPCTTYTALTKEPPHGKTKRRKQYLDEQPE